MRVIFQILLILLVVLTFGICIIKPEMHKTVFVYNSDYKLINNEQTTVETKEIPLMEKPAEPVQTTTKVEQKVVSTPVQTKTQQVKTVEKKTAQQAKPVTKTTQTNTTPKTVKTATTQTQPVQKQVKTETQTTPAVKQTETKVVQKPVETKVVETPVQIKVLTQEEESIAWNVWRSELQNSIMRDVKLPIIPTGTVFRFTFNVDKFGKVSNVQTWATPSNYTPYAIQYIAPVIRSYQGRSILNFPAGSTRITTQVSGGWKISANEKYSTPQDYNDVEKVIK